MDGFEKNKILMAILLALLIGMGSGKIADIFVTPQKLAQTAITIDGVEASGAVTASADEPKLEPIEPLLIKASVENGEKISKKCLQCHSLDKGGANKIGPNLYGIVGNKMAHSDTFAYSSALKAKQDTWTFDHINHFLFKPKAFIEGTKMAFIGIKKTQERADLVAFLNKNSDAPLPFPTL